MENLYHIKRVRLRLYCLGLEFHQGLSPFLPQHIFLGVIHISETIPISYNEPHFCSENLPSQAGAVGMRLPGVLVLMLLVAVIVAGMHYSKCGSSQGVRVPRLLGQWGGSGFAGAHSLCSCSWSISRTCVHQYIILKQSSQIQQPPKM